jgi:hypothetical protein
MKKEVNITVHISQDSILYIENRINDVPVLSVNGNLKNAVQHLKDLGVSDEDIVETYRAATTSHGNKLIDSIERHLSLT